MNEDDELLSASADFEAHVREGLRVRFKGDLAAGEAFVMNWVDKAGGLLEEPGTLMHRSSSRMLWFAAGVASAPRSGERLEVFQMGVHDGLILRMFRDRSPGRG